MEILTVSLCLVAVLLSGYAFHILVSLKIEIEAIKKSTHQVEFVNTNDLIPKPEFVEDDTFEKQVEKYNSEYSKQLEEIFGEVADLPKRSKEKIRKVY